MRMSQCTRKINVHLIQNDNFTFSFPAGHLFWNPSVVSQLCFSLLRIADVLWAEEMCSSESNSSLVLMDKFSEKEFRARWDRREWGKDHEKVREGSEKSQATIAPPVSVGQVPWEWPGRYNQNCCNTLVCVASTFFSQPVANRGKLNICLSRQGLQNPQDLEEPKPNTLATFPAVCIQFSAFPWVAAEPFHTGRAPMPFLPRVGGSPWQTANPLPHSPASQALRSPDLRWKNNQTQKWEGTWRKGVGALWNQIWVYRKFMF